MSNNNTDGIKSQIKITKNRVDLFSDEVLYI